jgi:uncharacterized cupredoxin-like copper-binding protein
MQTNNLRLVAVALVGLLSVLLVACGDDDSDSGSASSSGSATGEPVSAGVVVDKPAAATQVDVTLGEWQVSASTPTVAAGDIYFLVENTGPDDPHEFVIVRTDLAPGDLPTTDGKVPEDDIDLLDEIEPFTPGSRASITVSLEAGSYVLICNIAEIEEGELESHYELGMRTAFTVE